jgi:hypothetical protein
VLKDYRPNPVSKVELVQLHEAIRLKEWKRAQQHSADQAKNRGVGANTQCKRGNRSRDEPGVLAKAAERIVKVPQETIDETKATNVAAFLLHLIDSTELQPNSSARFLLRQPSFPEIGYSFFDVKLQLSFESRFLFAASKQTFPQFQDAPPSGIARISPTVSDRRFQLSEAAAKYFLPERVRE